jgi:hypothetical protein
MLQRKIVGKIWMAELKVEHWMSPQQNNTDLNHGTG